MNTASLPNPRSKHLPGREIVILIGIFKLAKGLLMILVAVAALALTRPPASQIITEWAGDLDVGPYRRHVGEWVGTHILMLNDKTLYFAAVGAAMYATLFFTEGMGLLFDKLWAEWVAVISTGGLIPVEITEIYRKHGILMSLTFIGNVAIVIYLARRVRMRMRQESVNPSEIPPARPRPDADSCVQGK